MKARSVVGLVVLTLLLSGGNRRRFHAVTTLQRVVFRRIVAER
ncbi:MAG: hypothetical protein Q8P51_16885 [Ignavibacteria bacterium]|nr:hypothetical protein [Ignavibacteria bacterium]